MKTSAVEGFAERDGRRRQNMAAAAPADKSVVAQSLRGIFKLLWSSRRSSSSITIRRSP